jgi:UDP-glucose 4-epimerase
MKCLVTGAQGFIGRHLVPELLRRGFDVIAFDKVHDNGVINSRKVRFVQGDIRDFARLRPLFDAAGHIFHLSGVLGTSDLFDNPKEAIDINIGGALNILLASSQVREKPRIFIPTKHTEPNNIYSMTAQGVEKLGHIYRENLGLDVRALILPNVYGPFQNLHPPKRAVPQFISHALQNRTIEIFGAGDQIVELIYAVDAAKAIIDYMLHDGPVQETFELFANDQISVVALAHKIIKMTNSKSPIVNLPKRRGELSDAEFVRANDVGDLLGSLHCTALETGMAATIDWYRAMLARSGVKAV